MHHYIILMPYNMVLIASFYGGVKFFINKISSTVIIEPCNWIIMLNKNININYLSLIWIIEAFEYEGFNIIT